MVTYNTVLSDSQYYAIAKKAAGYFQESAKSAHIPAIYTDEPDALKYRHTLLTKSKASEGIADIWSPQGPKATTSHGYVDYYLSAREMHLQIPKNDLNHYNDKNLLADKRAQEIEQFALDVDLMNFVGNYPDFDDRDAYLDNGGLLNQNTSVIDLNGTDSNLAAKGTIWAGIKKMIEAIPFRKREPSPPLLLYISENLAGKLSAPDRVYQDQLERDFIYDTYIGPKSLKGRRIGEIIVTNHILVTGTDTTGTHDRMLLVVPDKKILARVISRSFSLLDEESIMMNLHQAWGYRGALDVFDAEGVQFSEQIVWA